jgi:hypothetical protein
MDLGKHSIIEFERMQESLIGSLVCLCNIENEILSGKGLLINLRREGGDVYAKIVWMKSPFFRYKEIRKVGWHSIKRLFILQNKFGIKNYSV